jgi:hypothetical protein
MLESFCAPTVMICAVVQRDVWQTETFVLSLSPETLLWLQLKRQRQSIEHDGPEAEISPDRSLTGGCYRKIVKRGSAAANIAVVKGSISHFTSL